MNNSILSKLSLICLLTLISNLSIAQEDTLLMEDFDFGMEEEDPRIAETFHSTRIINGHSNETLEKKVLEFRVEHRFGDIGGDLGGIQTLYGLDNSADIRIAFEYGITDKLNAGFGRSKGTGAPYRSLLDGFVKYKILEQSREGSPVSITGIATSTYTFQKASTDSLSVQFFPKQAHRFAYATELVVTKKFGDRLSLALIPTVVHRNYVDFLDQNTLFSLGGGARIGLTSTMALLLEYYHTFNKEGIRTDFKNSLGIAFEWITFGHNFTINLTNSRGFGETQFIPYTYSDWLKGQFRLGFSIGRKFQF